MITPQPAMGSALDAPTLAVEPAAAPSAKPGVAGSNATQGAAWQLGGGVGGWEHGDLYAMNVK